MRRAQQISVATEGEAHFRDHDLSEIDNPQLGAIRRLEYVERLETILAIIERHVAPGGRTLEIGCAQANLSLILAERGYRAIAFDVQRDSLSYARKKHERGAIVLLRADAFHLNFEVSFDAVVLAEVVEHVSRPDRIIGRALTFLRDGGILVVTTPNGAYFRSPLPTYGAFVAQQGDLDAVKLGPGGEDHRYLLTPAELRSSVPPEGSIVEVAFTGGPLISRVTQPLLEWPIGRAALTNAQSLLFRIPLVGQQLAHGQVIVVQRH
jgi:2-polyprenyl-3-methyl-5-hydroxy-6-metoxy-1,4-benzoquinol methylase